MVLFRRSGALSKRKLHDWVKIENCFRYMRFHFQSSYPSQGIFVFLSFSHVSFPSRPVYSTKIRVKDFKSQWLLYVPPGLPLEALTFCPHSVFMYFVRISEQAASINWLVFITETDCVYCAVRTEYLNTVQFTFRLCGLKTCSKHQCHTHTHTHTHSSVFCCDCISQGLHYFGTAQ